MLSGRATFVTLLLVFLFILAITMLGAHLLPTIWDMIQRSFNKQVMKIAKYITLEFIADKLEMLG